MARRRLHQIGLTDPMHRRLAGMLGSPRSGLFLVAGPPRSGRTTTLNAILFGIDAYRYHPPTGIRPLTDVAVIEGLDDARRAEDALRRVHAGQRVYATSQACHASQAVDLLRQFGWPPGDLSGNLLGVTCQRLGDAICPVCREPLAEGAAEAAWRFADYLPGLLIDEVDPGTFWEARGCARCRNLGMTGRLGVFELSEFAPAETTAGKGKTAPGVLPLADPAAPLLTDCWRKVRAGRLSCREGLRLMAEIRDAGRLGAV
ncbi:MAG: hypothetical protein M1457_02540 [bacterium]|nr:hypothetical protein [bacterium]